MHNIGKTIGELHAMLIEYEKGLPKKAKTPQVMMIKGGKIQKDKKKSLKANGKGNDKHVYISNLKNPKPYAKEHPAKVDTCHHYKQVGYWKRNCHVYLAELLKKKKQVGSASSSSIFTIELFAFPNKSRVYDTGCGTHICITKQGFRESRKIKQGALYLYVGNGVRAQIEAIRSFDLVLPNGLSFMDYGILVSKNNVFYFNAIPSNDIYEIDMHDLVPNVNSIYNVSTKRAKHNLDSTYLWHCHLAHISKKRIEKLQKEGLLRSTDDESFDQCVSCLSGKMTRKSFSHRPERATDLLGIIHTDVCGPLRHVSRQATKDETSRILKNFITEIKNLVERKVKIIKCDNRTEFKNSIMNDFSEEKGIKREYSMARTPQQNRVAKRRNRTLIEAARTIDEGAKADYNNLETFKLLNVWTLVDLPYGKRAIETKWVFRNKRDQRGIIVRNKARLVAQGHRQEEGIAYDEVFALVARIDAISVTSASTPMETHKPLSKDATGIDVVAHLYSLDRKFTTGGCQFLCSRLISWQCKKQPIVANFTTKAEYIAASTIMDSAIYVVKNHVYHSKTKHIEIRHYFIRDSYEKRLIEMVKIHTDYNVADLLSKAFDVTGF
nr:hypothetical protein [Tanacetum cinerariifolium]